MKVRDVMSKQVVTVREGASVKDIAALLVEKHISGVPVVTEAGRVVGVVSQGDLLHRTEVGTERQRKWWLRMFTSTDDLARDYAKAHGLHARDVMTRTAFTITEDADLSLAADLLDRHNVKRLPVMRNGQLVGIVSRGDLVRALAQADIVPSSQKLEDRELHRLLDKRMRAQPWVIGNLLNVTVQDGVVTLMGFIPSAEQRAALRALVEETSGVARVDDKLTIGTPQYGAF